MASLIKTVGKKKNTTPLPVKRALIMSAPPKRGGGGGYKIKARVESIEEDATVPDGMVRIECNTTIGVVNGGCNITMGGGETTITLPGVDGVTIVSTGGVAVHKTTGTSMNFFL